MYSNSGPGYREFKDYEVTLRPISGRVEVIVEGRRICATERALSVEETDHHPVIYVPWADTAHDALEPTESESYCPFKGYASYWAVARSTKTEPEAFWAYLTPYDEVAPLSEYLGVYANRVDAIRIDGAPIKRLTPGWTRTPPAGLRDIGRLSPS